MSTVKLRNSGKSIAPNAAPVAVAEAETVELSVRFTQMATLTVNQPVHPDDMEQLRERLESSMESVAECSESLRSKGDSGDEGEINGRHYTWTLTPDTLDFEEIEE